MGIGDAFSFRQKPGGLFKWILRIPVWVFSAGLGFVFGDRILLLVHRGRSSGTIRRTPLEVVAHLPSEYVVCSGTGPRADWYRNIQASPALEVRVAWKRWQPGQRFLSHAEAAEMFADYESRHPRAAARLLRLMGNSYDGTDAGRLAMVPDMPMVAFSTPA